MEERRVEGEKQKRNCRKEGWVQEGRMQEGRKYRRDGQGVNKRGNSKGSENCRMRESEHRRRGINVRG